jgi:putative FmdB family regulatory protein
VPTYEYACESCGTFDLEQRITEPARESCDKCGGPVKRLISRSSFSLRGGGWYSDGYTSSSPSGCASTGEGCGGGACKKADA